MRAFLLLPLLFLDLGCVKAPPPPVIIEREVVVAAPHERHAHPPKGVQHKLDDLEHQISVLRRTLDRRP